MALHGIWSLAGACLRLRYFRAGDHVYKRDSDKKEPEPDHTSPGKTIQVLNPYLGIKTRLFPEPIPGNVDKLGTF